MKIPVNDALILELHKTIKKLGKIAQQDYANLKACIKAEVWNEKDLLLWAQHFAEDPWRVENKEYRTVAHFLRDPERWVEDKKPKQESTWTL